MLLSNFINKETIKKYDIIVIGDDMNSINKEKISDFVDVFLENIEIDRNHKHFNYVSNIIKESVYRRIYMYQNIKYIPKKFDNCTNYLIKPNDDGKYSIEDFFINRLMISLGEINFNSMGEIGLGGYTSHREISLNLDTSYKESMKVINDQNYANQFAVESLVHEIGHALQVSFSNSINQGTGFKYQINNYINLLNALKTYKDGKYKDLIIDETKLDINGKLQKTDFEGINSHDYSETGYLDRLKLNTHNLDEMMNELEATKVSGMVDEKFVFDSIYDGDAKSGYYEKVPNIVCGYRRWYGISKELYTLIGKNNLFKMQYGNADTALFEFDEKYKDVSQNMFGNDCTSPTAVICFYLDSIAQPNRSYKYYVLIHKFLARCIENKVDRILNNNLATNEQISEFVKNIDSILNSTLHHTDSKIDNELPHIIIYTSIKERLLKKFMENKSVFTI